MLNRVNDSMERKIPNAIASLQKQAREGKTNQAPSNLALSGKITVNQSLGTTFYFDSSGINYMQIGTLPDGSQGIVIAKSGVTVASLFS